MPFPEVSTARGDGEDLPRCSINILHQNLSCHGSARLGLQILKKCQAGAENPHLGSSFITQNNKYLLGSHFYSANSSFLAIAMCIHKQRPLQARHGCASGGFGWSRGGQNYPFQGAVCSCMHRNPHSTQHLCPAPPFGLVYASWTITETKTVRLYFWLSRRVTLGCWEGTFPSTVMFCLSSAFCLS